MAEEFINWLASDSGLWVYIGTFVLLFFAGLGFPIPEDIPLLLGGVAAAKNIVSLPLIYLVCYVGVIVGDVSIYTFGYFFGERLLRAGTRSPFFPSLTESKVEHVRQGWRKRKLLYVLIARHLFPIRAVTFLSAGALRIPFFEFLAADAIAALVSCGVMVTLGYFIGEKLTPEVTSHLVEQAHFYVVGLCLLMFVGTLLQFQRRKRARLEKVKKAEKKTLPEAAKTAGKVSEAERLSPAP